MPQPSWFHLTARIVAKDLPELTGADTGTWLWSHLRDAFPEAIAVTLMPDHPHLVVATSDPEAAQQRLARLLGQLGRCFGVRGQVSHVSPGQPIRGGQVLARQVRYVALNPCRRGLTRCPLAWMWTTHRDVVGAVVDPWVDAERLAHALGVSSHDFVARHHAYVSSDPHASIVGTPMPIAASPTDTTRMPLRRIVRAVLASTRSPIASLERRGPTRALFIALAAEQGWRNAAQLATLCGCCPHTIRRNGEPLDHAALAAARLCLGDARLRFTGTERSENVQSPSVKASLAPTARNLNVGGE